MISPKQSRELQALAKIQNHYAKDSLAKQLNVFIADDATSPVYLSGSEADLLYSIKLLIEGKV